MLDATGVDVRHSQTKMKSGDEFGLSVLSSDQAYLWLDDSKTDMRNLLACMSNSFTQIYRANLY